VSTSLPNNTPSDNQNIINQIDSFIAGLNSPAKEDSNTKIESSSDNDKKLVVEVPKTDQEMGEFILKHSAKLVESGLNSILELQKVAVATGNAELVASLASLIAANTGAIETVSKIHLQNKKVEANKELRKLDLEGKKEIQRLKNEGYLNLPTGNTNILMATREEIIAQLTGKARAKAADTNVIELSAVDSQSSSV
jgi:hypothetical protein